MTSVEQLRAALTVEAVIAAIDPIGDTRKNPREIRGWWCPITQAAHRRRDVAWNTRKKRWFCFACDRGDHLLGAIALANNLDMRSESDLLRVKQLAEAIAGIVDVGSRVPPRPVAPTVAVEHMGEVSGGATAKSVSSSVSRQLTRRASSDTQARDRRVDHRHQLADLDKAHALAVSLHDEHPSDQRAIEMLDLIGQLYRREQARANLAGADEMIAERTDDIAGGVAVTTAEIREQTIEESERELLVGRLAKYGSVRAAARSLGLAKSTADRRYKKHGIG